jgi:aryl-alcohol dehydrogenase-like predicted oxidoreductase
MYSWQFMKAQCVAEKMGGRGLWPMQNHYNLMYREEEREMLLLCKKEKSVSFRGARWQRED